MDQTPRLEDGRPLFADYQVRSPNGTPFIIRIHREDFDKFETYLKLEKQARQTVLNTFWSIWNEIYAIPWSRVVEINKQHADLQVFLWRQNSELNQLMCRMGERSAFVHKRNEAIKKVRELYRFWKGICR